MLPAVVDAYDQAQRATADDNRDGLHPIRCLKLTVQNIAEYRFSAAVNAFHTTYASSLPLVWVHFFAGCTWSISLEVLNPLRQKVTPTVLHKQT